MSDLFPDPDGPMSPEAEMLLGLSGLDLTTPAPEESAYDWSGEEPMSQPDKNTRRTAVGNDARFSDSIIAEDVAEQVLRGKYRYTPQLGWLRWDNQRWIECDQKYPGEALRDWSVSQYRGALEKEQMVPGAIPKEVMDGWRDMLKANKQGAVLRLAAGLTGILTEAADFDTHNDLLNAANGVIDLRTGDLGPHDPDLLITKMTRVPYIQGYEHPDWDRALEALPEETRAWYRVRMGQSATGYMTSDDTMVVCHGDGSNGKSTVIQPITEALGDYYTLLSDRVIMGSADQHPTELMDLRGARLAILEETPEARRLDVQRLKRTVGTTQIKARHIRKDSVTFDATHSIWINTNFKPEVAETDHGTWRRLACLPFPYTYRKTGEALETVWDRPGDQTFRDRCKNDPKISQAALAWVVDGAVQWYQTEKVLPAQPAAVVDATRAWRAESDSVLAFIDDRLIFDPEAHIASPDMIDQVTQWLRDKNMTPWNDRTIGTRFGGHELFKGHRVEKVKARGADGLSRPETAGEDMRPRPTIPSGPYHRWSGVRFRTFRDDES